MLWCQWKRSTWQLNHLTTKHQKAMMDFLYTIAHRGIFIKQWMRHSPNIQYRWMNQCHFKYMHPEILLHWMSGECRFYCFLNMPKENTWTNFRDITKQWGLWITVHVPYSFTSRFKAINSILALEIYVSSRELVRLCGNVYLKTNSLFRFAFWKSTASQDGNTFYSIL